MLAAQVYVEEWDVDRRLIAFGITRTDLTAIVRAVVAARADATDDDPVSAEGQFAYIFGTRHLRRLFCAKGYMRHRQENIESVKHPDRDLKIVYQSVDLACYTPHNPRAISGKGSGSDRVIDAAQGSLFDPDEHAAQFASLDIGVWYFCVSVDGDDIRAELSLPTGISGGNFENFRERIYILKAGEWPMIDIKRDPNQGPAEFEPVVSRK